MKFITITTVLAFLAGFTQAAPGLDFYEKAGFQGSKHSIDAEKLKPRDCVSLPANTKVSSIKKSGNVACCVLYRSPCLPATVDKFTQAPGYLNQRVFSDISSLEPYGWNDIVRSVMCLDRAACNAVQMDERKAGPWNLEAYWVDVKNLEKPVWV